MQQYNKWSYNWLVPNPLGNFMNSKHTSVISGHSSYTQTSYLSNHLVIQTSMFIQISFSQNILLNITSNPVKHIKHLLGTLFQQQNTSDIQLEGEANGPQLFVPRSHKTTDYWDRRQESEWNLIKCLFTCINLLEIIHSDAWNWNMKQPNISELFVLFETTAVHMRELCWRIWYHSMGYIKTGTRVWSLSNVQFFFKDWNQLVSQWQKLEPLPWGKEK